MADGLFQLAEALGPAHELPQDEHLPFVPDEHQGRLHRAGRQFHSVFLLVRTFLLFYTIRAPISIGAFSEQLLGLQLQQPADLQGNIVERTVQIPAKPLLIEIHESRSCRPKGVLNDEKL